MTSRKLMLLTAVAVITSASVAVGETARLGGNGVRVDWASMEPSSTSNPRVSNSHCNVRVNSREIVLHWNTSAFHHSDYPDMESDAVIAATVTDSRGAVVVSPGRNVAHTNLANKKDSAAVAMGIKGNGHVQINLDVGLDNPDAIAGKHCATVTLTLTGN